MKQLVGSRLSFSENSRKAWPDSTFFRSKLLLTASLEQFESAVRGRHRYMLRAHTSGELNRETRLTALGPIRLLLKDLPLVAMRQTTNLRYRNDRAQSEGRVLRSLLDKAINGVKFHPRVVAGALSSTSVCRKQACLDAGCWRNSKRHWCNGRSRPTELARLPR
jgi:hypothetical protein